MFQDASIPHKQKMQKKVCMQKLTSVIFSICRVPHKAEPIENYTFWLNKHKTKRAYSCGFRLLRHPV